MSVQYVVRLFTWYPRKTTRLHPPQSDCDSQPLYIEGDLQGFMPRTGESLLGLVVKLYASKVWLVTCVSQECGNLCSSLF